MKKIYLLILLLLMLALPFSVQAAKEYLAERYDVEIAVQPGGDLIVRETVTFRFIGGPFTFVNRYIPREGFNDLVNLQAAIDGQALPFGASAGQVEVDTGDPIDITWHFDPVSDVSKTFTLDYRVEGALSRRGGYDLLDWDALPNEYEYTIQSSTVTVTYPPELGADPAVSVQRGVADIQVSPGKVVFTGNNLSPDTPLQIAIGFPEGSLIAGPPAWQTRQDERAAQAQQRRQAVIGMLPVALLAAGAALAAGVGGALLALNRMAGVDRQDAQGIPSAMRPTAPPSNLPPALAGALTNPSAQVTWANGLATLVDLASRGVLRMEETPKRGLFGSRDFLVHNQAGSQGLRQHEQTLLEILYTNPAEPGEVFALSKLGSLLTSPWRTFQEAVRSELEEAGLYSAQRKRNAQRLVIAGVVALVLGLAVAIAGFVIGGAGIAAGGTFWLLLAMLAVAIGGAAVLAGFFAIIAGSLHSPLTGRGAAEAQRWQGYRDYLKDVTRAREPAGQGDFFSRFLPYAAAFGMAVVYTRFFRKTGGYNLPAWFQPIAGASEEGMDSFVAFFATSSSAGDSSTGSGASGGGDGGGGGGGGSGAG